MAPSVSRGLHEFRLGLLLAALALLAGCAVKSPTVGDRPPPPREKPARTEAPVRPAPVRPGDPAEEAAPEDESLAGRDPAEEELDPGELVLIEVPDPAEDPVTESPLDDLAETTPELTPSELEQERELVTESAPTFDIPIELNDRVLAWVDVYSDRRHAEFTRVLERSARYLERFRQIFAEAGVPQDLVYMAAVESGYKTTAYSRAHARGIFQFISATARRYGLRVDYWVDERSDPEKSARAAAAYMRDLYAEFGDWYLALAAYNAGEGKVRRAIRRVGSDDFWDLAASRWLRLETKNHVPAILAATLISKQPAKYGFEIEPEPAVEYDTIEVEGAADLRVLARCAGADPAALKELNPALRRYQTPPEATTEVRVPRGSGATTLAALAEIPAAERVLYTRHVVRAGDTLSAIAARHRVTVSDLQAANEMGRRTLIRVGQVLRVPSSAAGDYADVVPAQAGTPLTYAVRRGDTLSGIAGRHGTTASAIAAASGIRLDAVLRVGQRLTILPGVTSPTVAGRLANGHGAADGEPLMHTVRRGDTLWRIAARYETSVSRLCSLNRIRPSTVLHPGTRLTVGYK